MLIPNHSFETCGPEAFTSTTIFKKCGGKLARVVVTLHPEDPLGAPEAEPPKNSIEEETLPYSIGFQDNPLQFSRLLK